MKPRLILLSDLFGTRNSEWIHFYPDILSSQYTIKVYDSCELANIDKSVFSESDIHDEFINGGIDIAVAKLLELEKEEVAVLGFSIGGTIAWKAASKGLNCSNLFAISSTRLRFETEKPNCKIQLYFGEKDNNKPDDVWFANQQLERKIFSNQEHNLYKVEQFATIICAELIAEKE